MARGWCACLGQGMPQDKGNERVEVIDVSLT